MPEYTGKNLVVIFNDGTTDHVLPQVRRVRIEPEGGGVDRVDVTHAGDATKQYKDGIPDTPRDVATIGALDEAGSSSYYKTLAGAAYTAGTLKVYPEDNISGRPEITATGYMLRPSFEHAYEDVATVEVQFVTDEDSGYKFTYGTVV